MKNIFFSAFLFFAFSSIGQNAYFTYNKAYGVYLSGNYEGAITLFTQAINEKADLADAFANRGVSYYKLAKYENAISDFIKDNELMKNRSTYNLACCYALQGKIDEAFKALEQSQTSEFKQLNSYIEKDTDFEKLKSDPRWKTLLAKDFNTPYDKVMIEVNEKYTAKDYEGAIMSCDKAIEINKTDKRAIVSKAYIYSLLNKDDEAIAEYNKLLLNDVNDYEGYSGKADIYYKQKKYSDALSLYETATSKNPYFMPFYQTGMSKYALGKKDDGISDLKKHCELNPTDDITIYSCGRLMYDMQRDNEARTYVEKAIELNKTIPEYFLLRAYLNQVSKNWNEAISDYSKVISMNGNGVGESYYKRAICKGEKFAKTNDPADKSGFCDDMKSAKELGINEAIQYVNELCK